MIAGVDVSVGGGVSLGDERVGAGARMYEVRM